MNFLRRLPQLIDAGAPQVVPELVLEEQRMA